MSFLPVSKQDMIDRGIEQLDFVYVKMCIRDSVDTVQM